MYEENEEIHIRISDLAFDLLFVANQLHVFHWTVTGSGAYAQHEALSDAYQSIRFLTDQFVESYQGKHGLIKVNTTDIYDYEQITDLNSILITVDELCDYLQDEPIRSYFEENSCTDLLNVLDEILQVCNTLQYKLKHLG